MQNTPIRIPGTAICLLALLLLGSAPVSADILLRISTEPSWTDLSAWYNVTQGAPATALPGDDDVALVNRNRLLSIANTAAHARSVVVNNDPAGLQSNAVLELLPGGALEAGDLNIAPGGARASVLIRGGDLRTRAPVRLGSPASRFVLSDGMFTNTGTGARELFSFTNAGTVTISGGVFAAKGASAQDALTFYGPDIVVTGGEVLVTDGQALVHQNTRFSIIGSGPTVRLDRLNAGYALMGGTFRFVLDGNGEVSPIQGKEWILLDEATVIVDASAYPGGDLAIPLFVVTDGSLISLPSSGIAVTDLPEGVRQEVAIETTPGGGNQIVLYLREGDSQAPIAFDRLVSIGVDQPRQLYLPARDENGDTLTYQYEQPTLGTVTGTGPLVTYTPASDVGTLDSFTFTASDGSGQSNEATITLAIDEVALTITGLPADSTYIPETFEELWADYDPTVEALDGDVFQSTITEDGIVVQKVIFTIGTFETIAYGVERSRLAAYYAYPQSAGPDNRLPAVVHIHGGGGRADLDEVLYAARNGYVGLSLNWDARDMNPLESADIDIPGMEFDPNHPNTDWGALRDMAGNLNYTYFTYFGLDAVSDGTLDQVLQSPRNSLWFLTAIANRRALTFLQAQPEVDPTRLAVRGFSLGGVQTTILAGADNRLSAANPSVGGAGEITQERKDEIGLPGFNITVVPPAHALVTPITSLTKTHIPIMYTGPTNDFAAPLDNLMFNWTHIMPAQTPRRFAVPPRGNHENPVSTDVNSMLWFDEHLKGTYRTPDTPVLTVDYGSGRAQAKLIADAATAEVNDVDIYYSVGDDPLYRYWRPCERIVDNEDSTWTGDCLDIVEGQNLFAYAVVTYAFDDERYTTIPLRVKGDPITYNGEDPYQGDFILSSNLLQVNAQELIDAAIEFRPDGTIDELHDFNNGWDDWLLPNGWTNASFWFASSRKPWDLRYRPASDAAITMEVRVDGTKHFFFVADQNDSLFFLGTEVPLLRYYAGVTVTGDGTWQTITVNRSDFRPSVVSVDSLESLFPGLYSDLREPLQRWDDVLVLTIEGNAGGASVYNSDGSTSLLPGASWEVEERDFRNLRWLD